jgi:DNA-binding LacI/PurR family transcriptional regulator
MNASKGTSRRQKNSAVTLRDVAEKAGVHPGTVSRALQGDERVAPETIQNIQRIARELKYTPNIAARVLAMGKTQTIAIATGPANEQYYAQILYLLEKELTASNYKRLVLGTADLKRDLLSIVNTNAVDGVIAIDAFPEIDELMHSSEASILPCVYAGVSHIQWTMLSSVDIVKIDLSKAVREAVQAMLASSCRRVAYLIAAPQMASPNEVRAHVYVQTMEAAGLKTEVIDLGIGHTEMIHQHLRERLTEYVEKHGCPNGLLCQNDEVAILAHRALKDMGLRIPEDVQIVGCDGLQTMEYFDPPLSTIAQPAADMCRIAWRFLLRRIQNPALPRQQANLEARLRVRPSLKIYQH